MHCLVCGTEKEPGSWLCPNCGTPIPEPRKPLYKPGGWEWIAAILCFVVLWFIDNAGHATPIEALMGLSVVVTGPALAFSAARERRSVPNAVGVLLLVFWAILFVAAGWPLLALLGYFAFILTFEHVRWRRELARM